MQNGGKCTQVCIIGYAHGAHVCAAHNMRMHAFGMQNEKLMHVRTYKREYDASTRASAENMHASKASEGSRTHGLNAHVHLISCALAIISVAFSRFRLLAETCNVFYRQSGYFLRLTKCRKIES